MATTQLILSTIAVLLAASVSLLILWRGKGAPSSWVLVLALSVSAALEIFDLLAVTDPRDPFYWKAYALMAESLLPLAWLLVSLVRSREIGARFIPPLQRWLLAATLVFPVVAVHFPIDAFFYSPDFTTERVLFLSNTGYYFYLGLLVTVVCAMINLESTYANASLVSRWRIKLEIIGIGSFLAVLVFYYSQGLLYRTINMNMMPVRSLVLILSLAMIFYSAAVRRNGVRIAVSRSMAYRSIVLFAVGLYLVALGVMGEGLRYLGDVPQRALVIGGAFLVGICLLLVLLSETLKRKIKVFLHKNFYQSKYDYRTQWLQFTDRLASARDGGMLMEAILSAYCETFGMGRGALLLRDAGDESVCWRAGREMAREAVCFRRDDPVVKPMLEHRWVINLRDDDYELTTDQRRFVDRYSLIFLVPLFSAGALEGILALGSPVNQNERYYYEDYDLMKTLACQASSALTNLRLTEDLAQSRELEVMGRLSTFILHDLKNLVYTLSLTVDNARHYISDPEFQEDMLGTLGNTVNRMKVLISKLRHLPEKQLLNHEPVKLLELATEAAAMVPGGGAVAVAGADVETRADRDELLKVVINLLVNALEATDGKGPVSVEVGEDGAPFIKVSDRGCGISEEFCHSHLFMPFKTTKAKGLGIGLYQCKQIVEAHGGRIDVVSSVGQGSVFTILLPGHTLS